MPKPLRAFRISQRAVAPPDPQLRRLVRELRRVDRADMVASTVLLAQEVLRRRPRRGGTWNQLGDNLRALGNYATAERALRRALRLAPDEVRHWVMGRLGLLYEQRGDTAAAIRWFRKAIAAAPWEASWRIHLGGLLARRGRLAAAAECHRRATRCREGCIDEAWLNLGLVRRGQHRFREAARCFRKALELSQHYPEAKLGLRDVEYAMTILARGQQRTAGRAGPRSREGAPGRGPTATNRITWMAAGIPAR
ncbi:MAG: tetratricopeptide repeat protein [Planctomycetes bacterium]|nr:tetratricopeptide repeat protein [Planctomycetota bacterium]